MSMNEEHPNQPDELNERKLLVVQFIERMRNIDNEIELLKEDKKSLVEEFSEKLDVKTLNDALRVLKIKTGVKHKDTFDEFMTILEEKV